MGALCCSMRVNAESGTWPPFGKGEVEAMRPPPKAVLEPIVDDNPEPPTDLARLVVAAVTELVGPNNCADAVPPATRPPALALEPGALVRMKRWRRSSGFFWKSGLTSSTT